MTVKLSTLWCLYYQFYLLSVLFCQCCWCNGAVFLKLIRTILRILWYQNYLCVLGYYIGFTYSLCILKILFKPPCSGNTFLLMRSSIKDYINWVFIWLSHHNSQGRITLWAPLTFYHTFWLVHIMKFSFVKPIVIKIWNNAPKTCTWDFFLHHLWLVQYCDWTLILSNQQVVLMRWRLIFRFQLIWMKIWC